MTRHWNCEGLSRGTQSLEDFLRRGPARERGGGGTGGEPDAIRVESRTSRIGIRSGLPVV